MATYPLITANDDQFPAVWHTGLVDTDGNDQPITEDTFSPLALLHFDGSNGSTVVTDVYANTTWSIVGPGSLTTSSFKWGTAAFSNAGFFFGPGAVSAATFVTFGLGDFTIEIWFKSSNATNMVIVNFENINNLSVLLNNGDLYVSSFNWFNGSVFTTLVCNSTGNDLDDGAWHFAQVVRSALTTTVYIDGVSRATGLDGRDYATPMAVGVGGLAIGTTLQWIGELDDFRLSPYARPNNVPTGPFVA